MTKFPKFIPQNSFEQLAANILGECSKELNWGSNILPIDIEAIIEFHFNLAIEWQDLSVLSVNDDIWGSISGARKTIYLNTAFEDKFKENIGMMNFTKAHELGHWCLHVNHANIQAIQIPLCSNKSTDYICIGNSNTQEETQANMFASALLMPKDLLINDFTRVTATCQCSWSTIYNLAKKYEVSPTAMKVRLSNLHLIHVDAENRIFNSAAEANGQICLF